MRGRMCLSLMLSVLLTGALAVSAQASVGHRPAAGSTSAARTVVTGRVKVGDKAASGAKVTLYAWPPQPAEAALKVGQTVPLTVVGSATASHSGSYSITPDNWTGLRADAYHGIVNLQVQAVYQGHASAYYFPRKVAAGDKLAVDNEAKSPQFTAQHASLSISVKGKPGTLPACISCCPPPLVTAKWNNVRVQLSGEYSYLDSVKMGFSYSTNQGSTLGVGVEGIGAKAWKAQGTWSVSGGASQDWPDKNKAAAYGRDSHFTYDEYTDSCTGKSTHVTDWDGSDIHQEDQDGAGQNVRARVCSDQDHPG